MSRRVIFTITCVLMLWCAVGFINEAAAQAEDRLDQTEPFWVQIWNTLTEHPFAFSMVLVTCLTIFSTIMATIRKDKLLKSLAGQLITIELKEDKGRHRGRLRVESEGLEVVSEKANEGNEKVSYLLRNAEFENIHALVRYHDFLTDREKERRDAEVDRVYHPSIGMRLRRKLRNIVNEMKRVATEAFNLAFSRVKDRFTPKGTEREYGTEIGEAGQEAITYATEAAYDSLIDKLIGTKVVVRLAGKDQEYVGVLKDYTNKFIELLDVDYMNGWELEIGRGDDSKRERGLALKKDGDELVIQSKSPFKVILKHICWREDRPDAKREDVNKTIEPFQEIRVNIKPPRVEVEVKPFEKLRMPTQYHYREYKNICLILESIRTADIVMLKNYGIVRHRTEKYEPKLLDFGALTDTLLTSKEGSLVLEGAPENATLTIYNGYVTNLPKERMDFAEVERQFDQRWEVDSYFAIVDKKLRPISNHYFLRLLPLRKPRRIMALFALAQIVRSDEKRREDPILPAIYFTICSANHRKRRRLYKQEVFIRKRRRALKPIFASILKFRKLRLLRRTVPTEDSTIEAHLQDS